MMMAAISARRSSLISCPSITERFKRKADEVSKAFGFSGYSVREVSVSSADQPVYRPAPRAMAMEMKAAAAEAPVPVEAGKTAVTVMVNGSVQLK
mgnify:CR=1 FL=1